MNKIALVIPTIRDLSFLIAWKKAFADCDLIIIEDRPEKSIKLPHTQFASIHHYSWTDIHQEFGKNEWIFSRKNAGIRSYGFLKAWQLQVDLVVTLDDDCYPVGNPHHFIKTHKENLSLHAPVSWTPTYPDPKWQFTRGFPYQVRAERPVKVSHGIWSGALDLDAQTETKLPQLLAEKPYPPLRQFIPKLQYYPMCSMNLAFHKDVIPLMFFPMMGQDQDGNQWPYDRFDDIWAGILSKKIMDHLNWAVVSGSPQVKHNKLSMPLKNYQKEKAGLKENELFWQAVDQVKLTKTNPIACYQELAEKLPHQNNYYYKKLKDAMKVWINAF